MTVLDAVRYGDRGVLVWLPDQPSVLALLAELTAHPVDGQVELVPADGSLLVRCADAGAALDALADISARRPPPPAPDATGRVDVDVVYDGPDLDEVARLVGCSVDEVATRHGGQDWTVAFTGFAPGFGYLVGDRGGLHVPRRETPRTSVAAGSVALGGNYSAIYPGPSPGGWQLIGRADAVLWDLRRDPPALLRPGTRVRFRAVGTLPAPRPAASDGPYRFGEPDGPGLRIDRPGVLALVQDAGRSGLGGSGVPESGAADLGAYEAANAAVGNAAGAAALELVLGAAAVTAVGDQWIAVTGAASDLRHLPVVGPPAAVPNGRALLLRDGDQLRVGRVTVGLRSYLAVRGGLSCPAVLGSRSTDRLSGLGPPPVSAGMLLAVGQGSRDSIDNRPDGRVVPAYSLETRRRLAVTAGPHLSRVRGDALADLSAREWQVTPASDRVGIRLAGAVLAGGGSTLPSAPLVAGAVQLPPSGEPVVFLRDHPTTGGYPVIAVLTDAAIDAAAQLRPGDTVRFIQVGTAR